MNDYQLMRLSELNEEDAIEQDELDDYQKSDDFEEEYVAFYDDVKLKNTTKLDW